MNGYKIRKMQPDLIWVGFRLTDIWALMKTYAITSYGSGRRKNVVNQCLEFGLWTSGINLPVNECGSLSEWMNVALCLWVCVWIGLCVDWSVCGLVCVWIGLCVDWSVCGLVCVWIGLCVDWSVCGLVCVWIGLCVDWSVCGLVCVWIGLCVD